MSLSTEPASSPRSASGVTTGAHARADPLRTVAPPSDDVEARRARAAIESRLFSGPPQPVRVGRYRVEGRIGAGGMGVVYRAHDPELARDVAVKLMNTDGGKDAVTARARLVREARAMARLAHPNVIHVYDVGTVEDGVFIAMELVEGYSLSRWIEAESPPWREILRRYVEAGRGLAAAHAAEVIHRDFKPENVLLGEDGRVRVADFGLAGGPAAIEGTSEESQIDRDTGDLHGPVSSSLTKTGTLLGTPKYMAPEQESGAVANARSDQFSFCVALYEALYGYPPFAGDTVKEYRHNVRHGRVLEPPPDTKVKGWVHALIVRGLAVDPADRHPGLDPMLDRFEEALVEPGAVRRRRRRRRVLVTMVGASALLGAMFLGQWTASDDVAPTRDELAAAAEAALPEASGTRSAGVEPRGAPDEAATLAPPAGPIAPTTAGGPIEGPPDAEASPPVHPGSDGAPEPTATDDADSPEATESAPSVVADTEADPETRPSKRKRGDACYFMEDSLDYLAQQRRHSQFVRVGSRCYDCDRPMPSHSRDQVSRPECTRYQVCFAAPDASCRT